LPMPLNTPGSGLVVRVAGEAEAARRSLDTALAIVAPGGVTEIHKLQEFVAGRLYPYRVAYWISAAVGVLALLFALSGVYGVLSYVVAQRTKELSIRMALGADVRTVVWFVVRHSAGLAAIGLPTGTVVALAAARVFASRVPMVDVFDAAAFIAGVVA